MTNGSLAFADMSSNRLGVGCPGRIGPNAVIQLVHALEGAGTDPSVTREVFRAAGCIDLLTCLPDEMIDERIAFRLYGELWRLLPQDKATCVSRDAGRRTANYILANRIPGLAKALLRGLPSRFSAPLLSHAIAKNAWTFAGSGSCYLHYDCKVHIEIRNNPLTMPGCVWHVGVFERLFQALVSADAVASHLAVPQEGKRSVSRFTVTF